MMRSKWTLIWLLVWFWAQVVGKHMCQELARNIERLIKVLLWVLNLDHLHLRIQNVLRVVNILFFISSMVNLLHDLFMNTPTSIFEIFHIFGLLFLALLFRLFSFLFLAWDINVFGVTYPFYFLKQFLFLFIFQLFYSLFFACFILYYLIKNLD